MQQLVDRFLRRFLFFNNVLIILVLFVIPAGKFWEEAIMSSSRRGIDFNAAATKDEIVIILHTYLFAQYHFGKFLPNAILHFDIRTDKEHFEDTNVPYIVAHYHAQKHCCDILRGSNNISRFIVSHEIAHALWLNVPEEFRQEFAQISDGLYGNNYYPDDKFGKGKWGFFRAYGRRNPEENFCDMIAACLTELMRQTQKNNQNQYNILDNIERGDTRLLANLALFHKHGFFDEKTYNTLLPCFLPQQNK